MIIIAFCLRELLTFKECCGLAMVVVLNKLLVPPHVCQGLHCQLAVVYELIYYYDSQYNVYASYVVVIFVAIWLRKLIHEWIKKKAHKLEW